jgi:6-phosphogluconolactonase
MVIMSKIQRIYVGTYTHPIKFGTGQILDSKGQGIYLLDLDLQTGELGLKNIFKNIVNPSYLAVNRENSCLYAVNELKEFQGKVSGAVSAFRIIGPGGELELLNQQPTNGTDPCHVKIDPQGKFLFVSNFMSGSVSVFPILPDGSIGELSQFIQHQGSSVNPARQSGPHAHSLVFSPDGCFAFVPDLGLDKMMVYEVSNNLEPLVEAPGSHFQTKPGAGPRHCAFSPYGNFCYLINELDSTILALVYDKEKGSFKELQCVSSLPPGISVPGNTCADIHLTPNGAFLYGSNRGHNSLIIYQIDKQTGWLEYVDCQPCGGEIPRNFAIDPTGKFLLCANQDSDNIVVLEINKAAGQLTWISEITVHTPVCVRPIVAFDDRK